MDARAKPVRDILHTGDQYLVPFFQRYYSWTTEHWHRLWRDVLDLLEKDHKGQHFLGPLVCTPANPVPGEVTAYQLIDGQQRMTTLTIALTALRDLAEERGLEEMAAETQEHYLVHRFRKGLQRYKVVPRLGDREALSTLVDRKDPKPYRRYGVQKAYHFFHARIAKWADLVPDESPARLQMLLGALTSQLSLVVITIEGENPYEIFESLNSTGLPLEQSDLIRNYVFMQVPMDEQQEFHTEHWESFEQLFEEGDTQPALNPTLFYRNYLRRDGQESSRKATFVDFKEQYEKRKLHPAAQVTELSRFASYEVQLRRPYRVEAPALRRSLRQIEQLEITTSYPLLLHLMERRRQDTMSEQAMLTCLQYLASWVLRRSVCGESTRNYDRWFCEAIQSLGDDPCAGLREYLLRRGWPDDEHFLKSLQEFRLYTREPKKCRLVLEELERDFGHKEPVDLSATTIEHVMPQTLGAGESGKSWRAMLGIEWETVHQRRLHVLGNLTLSGYNPDLSNRPYKDKRSDLLGSHLELNRYFRGVERWDEDAILERGHMLAQQLAGIFPRPTTEIGYVPQGGGADPRQEGLSKRKRMLLQYWGDFVDLVRQREIEVTYEDPEPKPQLEFQVPITGIRLSAEMIFRYQELKLSLRFARGAGRDIFHALESDKESIEEQVGFPAKWEQLKGIRYITWSALERDLKDPLSWPAQHAWLADRLERVVEVLLPYIESQAEALGYGGPNDETLRKREFWAALCQQMIEDGPISQAPAASSGGVRFPIGRSGFHLRVGTDLRQGHAMVRLILCGTDPKADFAVLQDDRDAIEAAIGQPLEWRGGEERKICDIVACRDILVDEVLDPDQRGQLREWFVRMLTRFVDTFHPRIHDLPSRQAEEASIA